jgi:hypothetical protein
VEIDIFCGSLSRTGMVGQAAESSPYLYRDFGQVLNRTAQFEYSNDQSTYDREAGCSERLGGNQPHPALLSANARQRGGGDICSIISSDPEATPALYPTALIPKDGKSIVSRFHSHSISMEIFKH